MNKNNSLYLVIILISLSVIGFSGWTIYSSKNKQMPVPATTETTTNKDAKTSSDGNSTVQPTKTVPKATDTNNAELSKETAKKLVENFYREIEKKEYDKAYVKMSKGWQEEYPYEKWKAGYATTTSNHAVIIGASLVSKDKIKVDFKLHAVDKRADGFQPSDFRGHVDVIVENGKLVMDNPNIWKV